MKMAFTLGLPAQGLGKQGEAQERCINVVMTRLSQQLLSHVFGHRADIFLASLRHGGGLSTLCWFLHR